MLRGAADGLLFPRLRGQGRYLPPPPLCARTWRARALAAMPAVRLTLLVGGHAQRWHLGTGAVTHTVRNWREHGPDAIPLPHPSWRNTAWLKRNPWFEAELVPELRRRVGELLDGVDAPLRFVTRACCAP
jgi:uracil-DNA glycosylase